jgi:hypothetical protein
MRHSLDNGIRHRVGRGKGEIIPSASGIEKPPGMENILDGVGRSST